MLRFIRCTPWWDVDFNGHDPKYISPTFSKVKMKYSGDFIPICGGLRINNNDGKQLIIIYGVKDRFSYDYINIATTHNYRLLSLCNYDDSLQYDEYIKPQLSTEYEYIIDLENKAYNELRDIFRWNLSPTKIMTYLDFIKNIVLTDIWSGVDRNDYSYVCFRYIHKGKETICAISPDELGKSYTTLSVQSANNILKKNTLSPLYSKYSNEFAHLMLSYGKTYPVDEFELKVDDLCLYIGIKQD